MTLHRYRAIDQQGRLVRGNIDAAGPVELEARLARRGLELIDSQPVWFAHFALSHTAPPRRELIQFCFHLEQLLDAGIPMLDGLQDLRDATRHPRMREIVTTLREDIENGVPLSVAAEAHPQAFDAIACSLLHAGEQTGELAPMLRQLAETLIREDELSAHARKLAIYPAIVLSVLVTAVVIALTFVVPELAQLFRSTGQSLPLQTQLLIDASNGLREYGLLSMPVLAALCAAVALATQRSDAFAQRIDHIRLQLPVIGPITHKIAIARITRLFSMLYRSGITVLDALRNTEHMTRNRVVRNSLKLASVRIGSGSSISAAFDESGIFPSLVIRMLRVGEQTGALDDALDKVVYFYERDVRESIERLQASAEPALTLALGLVMLWIIFAVLGPIYDILTQLPV